MTSGKHVSEAVMDWQYGVVYWLALASEPLLEAAPPAGDGWVPNTDVGEAGHVIVVPVWSDGSIVQHRTHWRRFSLGMRQWRQNAHIRMDRRPWWSGSKVPDRLGTVPDGFGGLHQHRL
ncbi:MULTISPECIES: hypothetical protein [unclassified Kribbella]|uniref:hypothetical protein n=1 Tax=unclassified Kribbella TaxID=2644121 RepID=UPI00307799AA